jgi:hypothetical protein
MESEIRATTSAEVFGDCSDSQVLFSVGGELFGAVTDLAAPQTGDHERTGVCWIVRQHGQSKFLLATGDGMLGIDSYQELLRSLQNIGALQEIIPTSKLSSESSERRADGPLRRTPTVKSIGLANDFGRGDISG